MHAYKGAFQVLAHLGAVLCAHAAPLAAHAGFDRAQRLGVGVAAGHADVAPHGLQVFLLHAQQVDALAARDLDGGNFVFVHHIGDAAQLIGRGLAAPHAGHHGIGAVLLDVGVAALVDGAALRVVLRLLGPGADAVVVDGRAAAGAAVGGLPVHETEYRARGQQLVRADGVAHGLVAVVGAAAQGLGFGRGRVVAPGGEHQNLFDQAGARAAAGAGLGVLAHLVQREQALVLDGLADGALGDAIAAAHLVAVQHGGGLVVALVAGVAHVGFAKHQLVADVADGAGVAQQLEVPAAIHRVAIQASAYKLVVLEHQFLVHAAARVAHDDLLGARAALEVPGREQVDARHLELGGRERALVAANAKLR